MHLKRMTLTIVAAIFLLSAGLVQAEIYKWVDENGRVHFGDAPGNPGAAMAVQLEVNTFESVSYDGVEFAEPAGSRKVIMYATSWCGYCKQARHYFTRNNIPYTEYDIEKNSRAKRAYDALGGSGVPVILIGKKRLNGFSVDGFERLYK